MLYIHIFIQNLAFIKHILITNLVFNKLWYHISLNLASDIFCTKNLKFTFAYIILLISLSILSGLHELIIFLRNVFLENLYTLLSCKLEFFFFIKIKAVYYTVSIQEYFYTHICKK